MSTVFSFCQPQSSGMDTKWRNIKTRGRGQTSFLVFSGVERLGKRTPLISVMPKAVQHLIRTDVSVLSAEIKILTDALADRAHESECRP